MRLGGLIGALSAAWLVALQTASAAMATMLWTVDAPGLNALGYPVAGAVVGAVLALVVEGARRLFARRIDSLACCAGCVALVGYAGRAGVTALLRARQGMPGGRVGALVAQGVLVLLFTGLTVAWLQRRQRRRHHDRLGPVLMDGLLIAVSTVSAAMFVHLHWLAIKEQALVDGLLGPMALLLTGLAGGAGIVLGMFLAPPVGAWSPAVRGRVAGAAVVALALLGVGLVDQRPPGPSASTDARARGPNVLLIVLDTLRRDAVSAHGLVDDSTPVLDSFAAQGVLYEDCLANGSWTVPSHASLFTGAQVSRHGAGYARKRLRVQPGGDGTVPLLTLAEVLSRRGWGTAAYVCNMHISRANGFDRGFAEYQELWRARQGDYDMLGPARRVWFDDGVFDKGGELCLKGVCSWLEGHADDEAPWLLFVNFMEAHSPYYQAPERFARRFLRDDEPSSSVRAIIDDPMAFVYRAGVSAADAEELWRVYLGGVAYQDWLVGQVLVQLDAQGLAEDTLVIITSDHGENFGWNALLGHGQDVNDALVRVPLLARGPGLPVGVRDDTPVSLVDVLPTILSLIGADAMPADLGRTGVALVGDDAADRVRLSERLRWVEKYPMFLHDVAEYRVETDDGELNWAWSRRSVYRRDVQLVEVGGDVPTHLSPRLTMRGAEVEPPLDDGRRPLDDEFLAQLLDMAIEQLPWPTAVEPEARMPFDEDTLSELRKIGYVGN